MAVDKRIDSGQLDSDLTSVANAIRAKSGGSSQLAFPAGFVSEIQAIPSGGGSVTHVQYTAASDATSTSASGNTKAFYDTYIAPNTPSGNVILVCFVTNNSASGNYARAWFFCRDTKLRGSNLNNYWRSSSGFGSAVATNYDFFYTSGSKIDVWVLEEALS